MFEYGKTMHRFAEDAPFVTFNCADYYNNPQLLISHVFGYVKGAFTGAEQSKAGLVEEADGGVLFLDEIHRLPPEGQEMIFYFMDTGTFNRLGDAAQPQGQGPDHRGDDRRSRLGADKDLCAAHPEHHEDPAARGAQFRREARHHQADVPR